MTDNRKEIPDSSLVNILYFVLDKLRRQQAHELPGKVQALAGERILEAFLSGEKVLGGFYSRQLRLRLRNAHVIEAAAQFPPKWTVSQRAEALSKMAHGKGGRREFPSAYASVVRAEEFGEVKLSSRQFQSILKRQGTIRQSVGNSVP